MTKIKISGGECGHDPDKVWIKDHAYENYPSRFQSFKKFHDDCKGINGTFSRILVNENGKIEATCKIKNVKELTAEDFISIGNHNEKFGFVGVIPKGMEKAMFVTNYGSGNNIFLKRRGQDPINIKMQNRSLDKPLHYKRNDLQPKSPRPTSHGGLLVDFPKPVSCVLTATGFTHHNDTYNAYAFHTERMKKFHPLLTVIDSVRTECKI